jgi:hypothetical protein
MSLITAVATHCEKLHCAFCEKQSAWDVAAKRECSLFHQFDGDAENILHTLLCVPTSHPAPLDYNLALTSTCNKLELQNSSKL